MSLIHHLLIDFVLTFRGQKGNLDGRFGCGSLGNETRKGKGTSMTPYVQLQVEVIRVLFKLAEREPDYLRVMVLHYRQSSLLTRLSECDHGKMRIYGFQAAGTKDDNWDWPRDMLRIILAQVDDSGEVLRIRNLLGMPIVGYGTAQTVAEHEQKAMCGACFLRTSTSAQPSALRVGDILATSEEVLSEPRCGGDGQILVHLSGGTHGVWLHVPARIPIGLRPPPPVFDGTAETASLPISRLTLLPRKG